MKIIPYGKQYIDYKDKLAVVSSLSNEYITTGPLVKKFEDRVNKYLGCKFSHTCNSGTSAIHLAMLALNLKENDVILMPAVNFISSYNMAKSMNLKVYLVDVDENTGQITPNKVVECIIKNKIKKIKVLLLMYQGGYPENVKSFYTLKKKYKFFIIEDACHAFGASYNYLNSSIKIGSCKHSDICTFSLHPLKSITSGEGGIITTNNLAISKKIKLFRSHGITKNKKKYWEYDVSNVGYNYRLSDLNCALGLSQLNKLNFFLKKRKKIYQKYLSELQNFNKNLILPKYSKKTKPSYHLFIININFDKLNKKKDDFIKYLNKNKIFAQFHYIPIYKFSVFKERKIKLIGSEKYYKKSISIPIFVSLKEKEQKKIIKTIKNYF
tara:strand:+ start:290 stop:1432 length:1143 start_codon:yes stop_codon:yes gene_type:complete